MLTFESFPVRVDCCIGVGVRVWGCEDMRVWVWGCEGVRVWGCENTKWKCVSVGECESVKVCGGYSEGKARPIYAVSFCNTISKLLGDYCMHTHWPSPTCVCARSYGDRVTSNYPTLYQFTTNRLCLRQTHQVRTWSPQQMLWSHLTSPIVCINHTSREALGTTPHHKRGRGIQCSREVITLISWLNREVNKLRVMHRISQTVKWPFLFIPRLEMKRTWYFFSSTTALQYITTLCTPLLWVAIRQNIHDIYEYHIVQ